MNATALPSTQRTDLPAAHLSRNAVIVIAVVMLHIGLIWALQSGLKLRPAELIVPVEVLAQLIEPPKPMLEEPASPPSPAAPARPVNPAPTGQKKPAAKAPVQPPKQPLAIADPTPSPAAPTVSPAPAPLATPAPVAEAPTPPAAPPAPPAVQLPSSNADYLQNPKPAYPALSKRLGEQGKVIVRVLIGPDGAAQQAELGRSSGFERLDQAALATVLKWRYVPGKRGGVAEAMWFNVPINFVLE
jgi:periplasmic protein TonB